MVWELTVEDRRKLSVGSNNFYVSIEKWSQIEIT